MLNIDPDSLTEERMAYRLAVLFDAIANEKLNEQIKKSDLDYGDGAIVAEKIVQLSTKATSEDKDSFAVTPQEYDRLIDLRNKWLSFAAYGGNSVHYTPMGRDMNFVR